MTEQRPRSSRRKLGLIAPLSIAVGIVVIVLVAALLSRPGPKTPAPAPPAPSPPPRATPPAPEPIVGRSELIRAAGTLAAAYAADGDTAGLANDPMEGQRFALRLPFGCEGPQARTGAAQAYYEYDPAKRTVRLVARPANWTALPMIQDAKGSGNVEAAEGFWVSQPWSPAERCPTPRDRPTAAAPTPPAPETLGLVRLFTAADTRVGRRAERPYEHVVRLGEDMPPPLFQGYRLVLEGRFTAFADGRVAHCWSETPGHRPICVYAVQLDRVAFETGDGARQLAEWRD